MFDIDAIIKKYISEDGSIPSEAVAKLAQAVSSSVGREFVEKERYSKKLEEIEALKTEKQTAEDSATTAKKWKDKYDALKGEFDDYKSEQASKETKAAKEKAVRAYYENKGITGKSLDIAIRGSSEEINSLEMDGDKIKDSSALDELVKGTFSGLVSTTIVKGADTATPPGNIGGGSMTKADIYKKDDHGRYVMSAAERQKALMENQIT
jgi:predicted RNase H-like nuclease (RuvC/YqgF family)